MSDTEFAKIVDGGVYGQILVLQDQTDPIIQIIVKPKGFGLVKMELKGKDFEHSDSVFKILKNDDSIVINYAIHIFESLDGVEL